MSALDDLKKAEASKPAAYEPTHQSAIDSLLGQIQNRNFSYNFNADPLYNQYKDLYTAQGKQAGMNAMANASTRTGGFANSFGTMASVQANQAAMQQLNDKIPQLYDAAISRFNADTSMLTDRYNALNAAEQSLYGQYRDKVGDFQSNRDYYYNKYSDSVANKQWQTQFDYDKSRDQIADKQWQTQFDYDKKRDQIADKQWQTQFDYDKKRDQISDSQWLKEYNESIRQFNKNYALQKG